MLRLPLGQASLRYVYAAIIIISILLVAYQQSHLPIRIPEQVTAALKVPFDLKGRPVKCTDDVRSQFKVSVSQEVDRQRMRSVWFFVEDLFKENKPVPDMLQKPPRPKDGSDPDIPATREKVKISKADGKASKERHARVVEGLPEYPNDLFKGGRGLVVLGGNHYSEPAATSLGVLRELGSRLPVEVWTINEHEELDGWCDELAAEGMACRRLSDYMDVGSFSSPYQYKIFTMLFSSFEEIVFMDADSVPLKDPEDLLDLEPYNTTAAVLWPDYWENIASPHLPYIVGLTDDWQDHRWYDVGTSESGQILWNKRQHWKSLLLATYYNYYGPNFYYTLLTANFAGWGDKETFALALRALEEPFYQVKHHVVEVFQEPNSYQDSFHGIAMLQGDPRNQTDHNALFLHCNIIKFSMRDFFCDGCRDVYASGDDKPVWRGKYEQPGDFVYENLHMGLRILQKNVFEKDGLDPEPLLFKAMEYSACRSKAWGNEQLCTGIRRHMRRTFGFHFLDMAKTTNDSMDVLDKVANPDLCVVHPPDWQYFDPQRRGW